MMTHTQDCAAGSEGPASIQEGSTGIVQTHTALRGKYSNRGWSKPKQKGLREGRKGERENRRLVP